MIYISDRAKRLNETLHELFSNEQRWEVIQNFLDEERDESLLMAERMVGKTYKDTEGTAQPAGQTVLKTAAPNGVEGSTPSPSAKCDDPTDCGCRHNNLGLTSHETIDIVTSSAY